MSVRSVLFSCVHSFFSLFYLGHTSLSTVPFLGVDSGAGFLFDGCSVPYLVLLLVYCTIAVCAALSYASSISFGGIGTEGAALFSSFTHYAKLVVFVVVVVFTPKFLLSSRRFYYSNVDESLDELYEEVGERRDAMKFETVASAARKSAFGENPASLNPSAYMTVSSSFEYGSREILYGELHFDCLDEILEKYGKNKWISHKWNSIITNIAAIFLLLISIQLSCEIAFRYDLRHSKRHNETDPVLSYFYVSLFGLYNTLLFILTNGVIAAHAISAYYLYMWMKYMELRLDSICLWSRKEYDNFGLLEDIITETAESKKFQRSNSKGYYQQDSGFVSIDYSLIKFKSSKKSMQRLGSPQICLQGSPSSKFESAMPAENYQPSMSSIDVIQHSSESVVALSTKSIPSPLLTSRSYTGGQSTNLYGTPSFVIPESSDSLLSGIATDFTVFLIHLQKHNQSWGLLIVPVLLLHIVSLVVDISGFITFVYHSNVSDVQKWLCFSYIFVTLFVTLPAILVPSGLVESSVIDLLTTLQTFACENESTSPTVVAQGYMGQSNAETAPGYFLEMKKSLYARSMALISRISAIYGAGQVSAKIAGLSVSLTHLSLFYFLGFIITIFLLFHYSDSSPLSIIGD